MTGASVGMCSDRAGKPDNSAPTRAARGHRPRRPRAQHGTRTHGSLPDQCSSDQNHPLRRHRHVRRWSAGAQGGSAGIILACVLLTGCADSSAAMSSSGQVPTSEHGIIAPDAFARAAQAHNLTALTATFDRGVKIYTPVETTPFVGIGPVGRLFGVLNLAIHDLKVIGQFQSPHRYVFAFAAAVNGQSIQIVDLLDLDRTNHITTITVTARPIAGIDALAAAVIPHLSEIGCTLSSTLAVECPPVAAG